MKLKLLTIIFLFSVIISYAQVIISPYIVLTDQKNRFGSFIVQNESKESHEITVSFIFGYPVSDSLGVLSMKYFENSDSIPSSAVNWIKVFPKKFIIEPGQKQVIRMSVQPDRQLSSGTYWARIVTSSSPLSVQADTIQQGLTAKIKLIMNQVTTLLYRVAPFSAAADYRGFSISKDSTGSLLRVNVARNGNSPFYGDLIVTLFDDNGNKIDEFTENMSLYFELTKKFELGNLKPGNYSAEIKIVHNEKDVIPETDIEATPSAIHKINFIIY